MAHWHLDLAWLGDRVASDVLVESDGGRIHAVTPEVSYPPPGASRLRGLTLPGLANAHSHAFHRALRGRAQTAGQRDEQGTFWSWRQRMYAIADRLTPESYGALARATYAEMAQAGITCVGEFHYLHHSPGGRPYADPNEMGAALIEAAAEGGIRLTLLDTCYLSGGFGEPLGGTQRRFGDGSVERWAERVDALRPPRHARVGAAVHSVRALTPGEMSAVAEWARERAARLHVHVSEQPAENDACIEAYGRTPVRVLSDTGVLGPATTAVHATHLTDSDIELLGSSGTAVCACPTTERDLADGTGPMPALAGSGTPLTLGTDSHAIIDMFEESRALELNERLRSGRRGHWAAAGLLHMATAGGHAGLGWPEAGRIAPGGTADLVTLALDTPRLAGTHPENALESGVFAATSADVRHVVAGGRHIVDQGKHRDIDVSRALENALTTVWSPVGETSRGPEVV